MTFHTLFLNVYIFFRKIKCSVAEKKKCLQNSIGFGRLSNFLCHVQNASDNYYISVVV